MDLLKTIKTAKAKATGARGLVGAYSTPTVGAAPAPTAPEKVALPKQVGIGPTTPVTAPNLPKANAGTLALPGAAPALQTQMNQGLATQQKQLAQQKLDSRAARQTAAAAAPAAPVPEWMQMMQGFMADADARSAKERSEIMQQGQFNLANMQRRAALTNAKLGRSIGGGFASLQGQAYLGAAESTRKALAEQALRSGDRNQQIQQKLVDMMYEKEQGDLSRTHDLNIMESSLGAQQPLPGMGPSADKTKYYGDSVGKLKNSGKLSPEQASQLDKLWNDFITGAPGAANTLNQFLNANGQQTATWGQTKRTNLAKKWNDKY